MKKDLFIKVANDYLSRGWNVSFAHKLEKFPSGISWHHLKSKKVTQTELTAMAKQPEEVLNICIFTGKISDLIVVDIDDETGYDELKSHGIELPPTLTVKTSRGFHHYYKYVDSNAIKTVANILSKVDIRADGGLVIAPPSVHASGSNYEWVDENVAIAEFPKTFLHFLEQAKARQDKKSDGILLRDRLTEGNRNGTLISVAGSLRNLGISEANITQILMAENNSSKHPLPDSEVRTIIQSALRYPFSDKAYELTDMGNMHRFVDTYKGLIGYNSDTGKWMQYRNGVWTSRNVGSRLLELLEARLNLIPNEIDLDDLDEEDMGIYDAYVKWTKTSKSKSKVDATLKLAESRLEVHNNDFDKSEMLFNVRNGVIDLETGELLPHSPSIMCTKQSPIVYKPESECPVWDKFLNDIFEGNEELISWIQKAVGYSMTGSTKEEVFFLLHGTGSNGKTKFLEVLDYILGDYGEQANFKSFTVSNHDSSSSNDIAKLAGSRLVLASESNKGQRFNEALVKKLTGDKKMTARFLYKEEFTFNVTFKIWLATNYLPSIYDDTDGTWRRIKIIPFRAQFKGDNVDKDLYSKLIKEATGIFNWCLEGCKRWQAEGLGSCSDVDFETTDYRDELDTISLFLEQCTTEVDGERVNCRVMYDTYSEWCKDNGHFIERQHDFKVAMQRRGITVTKISTYFYKDIQIKTGTFVQPKSEQGKLSSY